MNFASSHVLYYDHSDEEYVSDDELEQGMTISDSSSDEEDNDDAVVMSQRARTPPKPAGAGALAADGGAPPGPTSATGIPLPPPPPSLSAPPKPSGGLLSRMRNSLFGGSAEQSASADHKRKEYKRKKSHWRSAPNAVPQIQHQAPVSGRKWRRADTNVVSIKFDRLTAPSDMHTGDAVYCQACKSVFSHLSHLSDPDKQMWKCEFCGGENSVDLMEEEIPKKDDVTYMLEPAPTTTAAGKSGLDDSLVIFCVDTSGSMCVTTEVPGKVRLRGNHLDRLQSLNTERESQWMPGQSRNVTYVSRLQGMQAAVANQLEEMEKNHPDRRVALIAFNSEVTVIGDGLAEPVTLSGDKLGNKEELVKVGTELALPGSVKAIRKNLEDKVFDLEEGGATALGPALLVAVSMACQIKGSKVILCTDGMANVGLGSLDSADSMAQSSAFYSEVAGSAVTQGVSVSAITIKGTDCKLVELGQVAEQTGGQVNIVDPLKLMEEFGSILADPIIATNVTATLMLHKGLYFRNEDTKDSCVTRYVGNVTKATEVTFEYGVRVSHKRPRTGNTIREEPEEEGATSPQAGATGGAGPSTAAGGSEQNPLDDLTELPFQLQITYTDMEGGKALRVLTQAKPITKDRALAERNIDVAVLGVHTAQTSGKLAMEGKYSGSRMNAMLNQRLVARYSRAKNTKSSRNAYECFYDNVAPLEQQLLQVQQREISTHGRTHSDDEDEEEGCEHAVSSAPQPKKWGNSKSKYTPKVASARRNEAEDEVYNVAFRAKSTSDKAFK